MTPDEIAERMASAIVKRLTTRKVVDVKDEAAAKAAIRQVVVDNLASEDRIDADAKDDQARFGLAFSQLLGGVEHITQSLYKYGFKSRIGIPFIMDYRLPVGDNPPG